MSHDAVTKLLFELHKQRDVDEKPFNEYAEILAARDRVYAKFQNRFSQEGIGQLSAEEFREFLSFKHNEHWTGLQRSTAKATADMPRLHRALEYLFDESVPLADRIDTLTDTNSRFYIHGVNKAVLTPLLLIRFPEKYGVWNGKAEAALKSLAVWPAFRKGATLGEKYVRVNDCFLKYAGLTAFDLWTLDGLWHVVNAVCSSNAQADAERENANNEQLHEGTSRLVSGLVYERNPKARRKCIEHHGTQCKVCGFDFFSSYGALGLGFIHVHHKEDVAIRGEGIVNPEKDMIPVCPNCHAMLHRNATPARTWQDLKRIMASVRSENQR